MNPADLLSAMKRTVEQLAAFNEIAKALTSTLELKEVLSLVMQKVSDLLQPRNWSLMLQDEHTGQALLRGRRGRGRRGPQGAAAPAGRGHRRHGVLHGPGAAGG